jgi:hypothetical protein
MNNLLLFDIESDGLKRGYTEEKNLNKIVNRVLKEIDYEELELIINYMIKYYSIFDKQSINRKLYDIIEYEIKNKILDLDLPRPKSRITRMREYLRIRRNPKRVRSRFKKEKEYQSKTYPLLLVQNYLKRIKDTKLDSKYIKFPHEIVYDFQYHNTEIQLSDSDISKTQIKTKEDKEESILVNEIIEELSIISSQLKKLTDIDEKLDLLYYLNDFLKENKEIIKEKCPDKIVSILNSI